MEDMYIILIVIVIYLRGLKSLLPSIIVEPKIIELRLAGNNLTDDSIVAICYELEKAYHTELLTLDLSENKITSKGGDTLIAFLGKAKGI
jgi:hypothetical protein